MDLNYETVHFARLMFSAFLAVLFLQSGLDKVLDWAGNKTYIASVFEKTPFKKMSTLLLFTNTCMEVGTGLLSAAGVLALLFRREAALSKAGAMLACLTLLGLFAGQRVAKDYAGAAGLVPYFLLAVVATMTLG